MKLPPKPVKRSKQLAPLSREHHETLLFTWKIRQGIKYGVSNKLIVEYCNWFWKTELKQHFQKEEQAVGMILPVDHPMMAKMVDDHQAIEIQIKQLSEYASEFGLERLDRAISNHVRYEERLLFNYVERIATSDQLDKLLAQLIVDKKDQPLWKNQFWLKT